MSRFASAAGLTVILLCAPARAAGPFDDLLRHTPNGTNTLALIDAKAAFESPLAKKENWKEQGQNGHRTALGFVPAGAGRIVIGSEVNFTTLVRNFQIGLVQVSEVPAIRTIASREGGSVDQIAERFAAVSPRDVYFTNLS
jgi:hypothetical protein